MRCFPSFHPAQLEAGVQVPVTVHSQLLDQSCLKRPHQSSGITWGQLMLASAKNFSFIIGDFMDGKGALKWHVPLSSS